MLGNPVVVVCKRSCYLISRSAFCTTLHISLIMCITEKMSFLYYIWLIDDLLLKVFFKMGGNHTGGKWLIITVQSSLNHYQLISYETVSFPNNYTIFIVYGLKLMWQILSNGWIRIWSNIFMSFLFKCLPWLLEFQEPTLLTWVNCKPSMDK